MKTALIALAGLTYVAAARAAEPPHAPERQPEAAASVPAGHVCFNAVEAREKIAAHRLSDPLRALRLGRQQGEALRAKLCRFKQDEYVYLVYVLRRDGHLLRLYVNAQNGQAMAQPNEADRK